MAIRKTLTNIVLAGALALGGFGCGAKSTENNASQGESSVQTQLQYQTRNISGKIVDIDEDSFAFSAYKTGANFEFEHLRIETNDGKVYKLIFPGPSNYRVGDSVDLQYKTQERVSHQDLINVGATPRTYSYLWQNGFFEVDGIILR